MGQSSRRSAEVKKSKPTKLFLIQKHTYLHQSTMKMATILIIFFLFVFTAEHCTSKYLLVEIDDNQGAVAEPWSRMTVQPPRCTFRNANEVCKGKEICIREKPGTEGF